MMLQCRNRPNSRLFCMYLMTSIILTTIIYVCLHSHTRVSTTVDGILVDVQYLMKEVRQLGISVYQTDSNRRGTDTRLPDSSNTLAGPSSDQVDALVRKYVDNLRADWMQTKVGLEATISQLEKRIASTQIAGETLRTDYAMESLGGQVVHVEDTPYIRNNYILVLLGLAPVQNEPRNILRPSMSPGDCYAFKGTRSKITIRLMAKVFIDSVSVQHIPENMSPSGTIKSAPKDFSVYGLKFLGDPHPFFFGSYIYDASLRKPVQIFIFTQVATESHRYVQFNVISNNGHMNFTCIYRLSVHGKVDTNSTGQSCMI